MKINLKVYRAEISPSVAGSRTGSAGPRARGIDAYNEENKVEPMRRALRSSARTLGSPDYAATKPRAIADRISQVVERTLEGSSIAVGPSRRLSLPPKHNLPTTLWEKGYVSIGDTTARARFKKWRRPTRRASSVLKRECGIHEINLGDL